MVWADRVVRKGEARQEIRYLVLVKRGEWVAPLLVITQRTLPAVAFRWALCTLFLTKRLLKRQAANTDPCGTTRRPVYFETQLQVGADVTGSM